MLYPRFIVFSHSHADHTGGFSYILEKNIKVDRIYMKNYDSVPGCADCNIDAWNVIKNSGIPILK